MGCMAHGHAAPAAVKGAIYDVVTQVLQQRHELGRRQKKLAEAVANAK